MKLHFEPNLDFQRNAIEAVCDLFRGQETCRTEFTVAPDFDSDVLSSGSRVSSLKTATWASATVCVC